MYRTKYLDCGVDSEVASNILDNLDEMGYSPEESIPGLIQAVFILSEKTGFPEECLDEAANLLAESGS